VDPYQAGTLLNIIGPEAIPFAIDALDSQSLRVRLAGLTCLERASLTPQNRRSAITNLTKLLTDPSSQVRQDAAYILGEIGPEASSAVPPLIVNLSDSDISDLNGQVVSVRAHTAQALGKIGPAAKNASPALRRLLTDPDVDLRSEVAVAIWRIDGDVEHTLPVLVAGLPNVDPDMKWQWIDDLGEMGPRASNAFPILVEELKGAEPYNLEKITNAMFKIDPEAAAKLLH
jgi:HEAT repeat protein